MFHFPHFQSLTWPHMAARPYAARAPLIFRGAHKEPLLTDDFGAQVIYFFDITDRH